MAAPVITTVTAPGADRSVGIGGTIYVYVMFDEGVVVEGGIPTLALETGTTDRAAIYFAGSGTSMLTFEYVVQEGDSTPDLDYISTTALQLNGAVIRSDGDGTPANLVLPTPGAAGSLGANRAFVIDGIRPAAPAAPDLATASDSGTATDNVTNDATPTLTGSAEANGRVKLYDTDGTLLGTTIANASGAWSWTLGTLANGTHSITATVTDAAGNESARSDALGITIDTVAPTVAISSDKVQLHGGETATVTFTFSEAPGGSFTAADISVSGGTIGPLSGSGTSYTATFTPTANYEGIASIAVNGGAYADQAFNIGQAASFQFASVDTLAPARPAVPTLAVASDTGDIGDQITSSTTQVIEGVADANATITMYDGAAIVATFQAGADGTWSHALHLAPGNHALAVTQTDAAGNVSAVSIGYALTVEAPATPPVTPPVVQPATPDRIDGALVTSDPALLYGGVIGTRFDIATVAAGMGGADGIADVPLGGLTAHLPAGYGLAATVGSTGAGAVPAFVAGALAASAHAPTTDERADIGAAALQFLATAPAQQVQLATLAPVGTAGVHGALTVDGGAAPFVAVIDGTRLAADNALALTGTGFAAVLGGATVRLAGDGVLAGDGAAQDLSANAGHTALILAGGGSDTVRFGQPATAQATSGTVTLHGGSGYDTAVFTGSRNDYDIEFHNGYVTVASRTAPQEQAVVVNVEQLRFVDIVVQLEGGETGAIVAGLYDSVLGRQADLQGFAFWADGRDAGASWGSIALAMIGSAEHGGTFTGEATHDIELLYQSLFGRQADAGGLAFWRDALAHGASLEQVATGFVVSAEMIGHQVPTAGWDFTV